MSATTATQLMTAEELLALPDDGVEPVLSSASQELSGDPELPGFRVKVADLFAH